uniref:Uncharacterized protein n=1 Tax=Avena sativa TaxID=4498 RepID=A0ACD5Z367_AVESA
MAAGTRKPPSALAGDTAATATQSVPAWLVAAGLVLAGLCGGALLVWWAVAFHPANARLWMVPVGLVLLGTPLVACLSVFASGPCEWDRSMVPPPAASGA